MKTKKIKTKKEVLWCSSRYPETFYKDSSKGSEEASLKTSDYLAEEVVWVESPFPNKVLATSPHLFERFVY